MPEPITVAKTAHAAWKLRKPIAIAGTCALALVLMPVTVFALGATAVAAASSQCADQPTPSPTPFTSASSQMLDAPPVSEQEPAETNRPPADVCNTLAGIPGGASGFEALLIDSSGIAAPDPKAREAIAYAYTQIGKPYVDEGRARPPDSWDCSKLTAAAWGHVGVSLVAYSYTQYDQVQRISRDQVQPGDLIFWFKNDAHHVAIVDTVGPVPGNPTRITFVEAANPERGVVRSELLPGWYEDHLSGFGRVIRSS